MMVKSGVFLAGLGDYETIDRLLASAEARRNAAFREMDRRRESLASRMRMACDELKYDELHFLAAAAASGKVR
jgi:hypothetical protein